VTLDRRIQRDLELGTWNGKLVIVTDQMPVSEGYFDADANTTGALPCLPPCSGWWRS